MIRWAYLLSTSGSQRENAEILHAVRAIAVECTLRVNG